MRTEIQLLMQIDEQRELMFSEYGDSRSENACDGMIAGFKTGIRLTKEGRTEQQIIDYIYEDEAEYRSFGDDDRDAYQSGFTCALWWAADQYEWDADGMPVYHDDAIIKWQSNNR